MKNSLLSKREKRIHVALTTMSVYRVAFVDRLDALLHKKGIKLLVFCGDHGFEAASESAAIARDRLWFRAITQRFLFEKRILWLGIPVGLWWDRAPLVVPLNPRTLSSWLILLLRRLIGRRTAIYGHAFSRKGERSVTNILRRAMMRLSGGVLVYTNEEVRKLQSCLPRKLIAATGNSGVSLADCTVAPTMPLNRLQILYSGRLTAPKKVDILIRAFAELSKHKQEVFLTIIGEGPEEERLLTLADELRCREKINFLGAVWDPQILSMHYANAFCAVSPGYVGLACIQSFARGVPMVISRGENHAPEIEACLEHFNTLFFKSDDPLDMAAKLTLLWEARTDWFERSEEISKQIRDNYTIESMAANTLKFLMEFSNFSAP